MPMFRQRHDIDMDVFVVHEGFRKLWPHWREGVVRAGIVDVVAAVASDHRRMGCQRLGYCFCLKWRGL